MFILKKILFEESFLQYCYLLKKGDKKDKSAFHTDRWWMPAVQEIQETKPEWERQMRKDVFTSFSPKHVAKNRRSRMNHPWWQREHSRGHHGAVKEEFDIYIYWSQLTAGVQKYAIKWSKFLLSSGDKWRRRRAGSILLWHRGLQTMVGSFTVTASLFTDATSVSNKTSVNRRLCTLPHTPAPRSHVLTGSC